MIAALLLLVPCLAPQPLLASDQNGLHSAVVPMGDLNGDGTADFAMGHRSPLPAFDSAGGEHLIWALSGVDGAVLHTWTGGESFGASMANIGDVDGDGVQDLATSEVGATGSQRQVRLLSGKSGAVLKTLLAPANSAQFGVSLAGGAQLVGDSTPDLLIGASGVAWIVDGSNFEPRFAIRMDSTGKIHRSAVTDWSKPDLPEGETGPRKPKNDQLLFTGDLGLDFGHTVATLPDMDGDGLGEVVLGATLQPKQQVVGSVGIHVSQVFWSTSGREALALATNGWCVLGGQDLDGDKQLDIVTSTVSHHVRAWSAGEARQLWEHRSGTDGYNLGEGTSLAFVADRNGDGVPEVLMGQNSSEDFAGGLMGGDYGHLFLLSGATGEVLLKKSVKSIGRGKQESGVHVGGVDVACLGDVDGDGQDEIIVQLAGTGEVLLLNGADLEAIWAKDLAEIPRGGVETGSTAPK